MAWKDLEIDYHTTVIKNFHIMHFRPHSYSGEGDSDSLNVILKRHERPPDCFQPHTFTQCVDETTEVKGLTQDHTQSWWLWTGEAMSLLTSRVVPVSEPGTL